MKKVKQNLISLVMVLVLAFAFGMQAEAANRLSFQDPTVKVGEEVTIRTVLKGDATITKGSGTLTYDPSFLEFKQGTNATGGNGKVELNGEGTTAQIEYSLTFRALKSGTTKIEVESFQAADASGELEVTKGNSTVTINPGANGETEVAAEQTNDAGAAATGGGTIKVDGKDYTIAQDFTEAEIPEGFKAAEMTLDGQKIKVVTQESSGQSLIYLASPEGEKSFYVYNEDDGTASFLQQVYITNNFYIILLNDKKAIEVPSYYKETTLTVEGHDFPAWQNTKDADFYAVYALSSNGNKGTYSYDSKDETYQRMLLKADNGTADTTAKGFLGKITQFISDHLQLFVLAMAALILILVIVLIVLAVKLFHRNAELDDLYDEYGIDTEDEKPTDQKTPAAKQKAPKKSARQSYEEDEADDEEFEEFDDYDDYDDEDDDFIEAEDEAGSTAPEREEDFGDTIVIGDLDLPDEEDDVLDTDDTGLIEDLDELLQERPKGRKKTEKKPVDDDFDTDFIDLD